MNNSFLVVIKGIIAVFLNRKLGDESLTIKGDIKELLANIQMPTNLIGTGSEGDIAIGLRETLEWLLDFPEAHEVIEQDLMDRIILNTKFESQYSDLIQRSISTEGMTKDRIKSRVLMNMHELKSELKAQELSRVVREANKAFNNDMDYVDKSKVLAEFMSKLDTIKTSLSDEGPVSKSSLSSDDPDSIIEILESSKAILSTEGSMRLGLVGLNRLLGGHGLTRGNYVNVGALTHNYKTGILLDIFRWVPMYNKPFMMDPNKKPLVLRISFENRIEQDLPKMYKDMYEVEFKTKVDIKDVNSKEAVEYIRSKLCRNGYNFAMEFFSPNDFTVDDLLMLLDSYEQKGYEIHLLDLDYLALLAETSANRNSALANEDAIERVRGYCFPKGITVVSGHQLSSEAQALAREGAANLAKRCAQGGWYKECKTLHTKMDVEIIQHIVNNDEESFLTFARGKHRGGEETPLKHRTVAYKMHDYGTLHDDVEKEVPEYIYDLTEKMLSASLAESDTPAEEAASSDW